MNTLNPEFHTCPDCGYQWRHGQHGGHSCVDRLVKEIAKLKSELDELVSTMASLLNDYKDTLEGLNYYRVNDFDSRDGDYRDAYDADDSAVLAEKLIEKIKGGAA